MKIVVLAGGISTERNVSIVSGTDICKALRRKGHLAILVDVYCGKAEANVEEAFPEVYDVDAENAYIRSFNDKIGDMIKSRREFFGPKVLELCQAADVVFMALHGADGENGKVQAAFDLFGIRYTGTGYLSSALAMDKSLGKRMLSDGGVPVPGGVALKKGMASDLKSTGLELPLVVKPCCGGSSVGVSIARTEAEYASAVEEAFRYENEIIIEEYIEGREFSVGVIGGKAYPIIEIAPIEGFYDYKNKYSAGSTIETCPANLTKEETEIMQKYAEMGSKALQISGYSRLDFLMRPDGRMYCLEANTLPGMTPTSLLPQEAAALGINYEELCELLIRISEQR